MEVITKSCKDHPSCPHGPCLMFERHSSNGAKTGKRFFACSACRDRSVCSFFHWVDDKISATKKDHWERIIEASKPHFTHEEYMMRLSSFQQLPLDNRRYCKTCSLLVLPQETIHKKHEIIENISPMHLTQPSFLFQTLEDKRAEAQYFFSEKTISFVTSLLKKMHFSKVVLIGVPKIHEHLVSSQDENSELKSLFMDIDHRYKQFCSPAEFCHYNLFNNHFFDGKSSKETLKQFLSEKNDEKVVILLDPPFGGLIDAISYTLKTINKWWQVINGKTNAESVPILWFFPYFLEPRIRKTMPEIVMMDYKVDYMNHKKFGSKAGPKGSPVRIFTNIEKSLFVLPKKEGYRFCVKCQRYVSKENQHCSKCNVCPTKHGNTYKHCNDCQTCVKSSSVHCEMHNKCAPPVSNSQETADNNCKCGTSGSDENNLKCYKCFGFGHRKRDCPVNMRHKQRDKKKLKQ